MIDNLRGDLIKINKLEDLYKDYYASAFRYLKAKGIYTPGFVWGCGDVDAKVVLIGEAPGRDEVDKGIPFAGKAGGILDEFISCTSCKRDEMFITNTIKYRLSRPRKNYESSLSGVIPNKDLANRPATIGEVCVAAAYLKKELEILEPEFIVTLGNTPLKAVFTAFFPDEPVPPVSAIRGKPIPVPAIRGAYLYPVFHPASLIYTPGNAPLYKADLLNLASLIKSSV